MAVGCETGTSPELVWSDMGRTPPWDRSGRAGRASNGQWLASITGMPGRATVVGLVFDLGLSLLLATTLLDVLRDVVPPGLARRIGATARATPLPCCSPSGSSSPVRG